MDSPNDECTVSPTAPASPASSKTEESNSAASEKFLGIVALPMFVWWILRLVWVAAAGYVLYYFGAWAFNIRTYAIKDYGRIIHEFDPWFNFRATQYLEKHGLYELLHWYDYKVWYPIGRPVGTTIYPGMQMLSVFIYRMLAYVSPMSLNDVCVFVPCWLGVSATMFTGLLAYECSGSRNAGVITAAFMAILPAHLMRSIGGGYDNESVAMSAMTLTFYLWSRAVRGDYPRLLGIVAGLAYGFMAATWGGFIFVLNMIALHAAVLAALDIIRGKYCRNLYHSYTLFFIVGTFLAVQVPTIGWNPFRSLEQLAAFVVFIGLQLLHLCEVLRLRKNVQVWSVANLKIKVAVAIAAFLVMFCLSYFVLLPMGYFGPLTARIRGLFVKHTRTGNPLVDSVAEHQPGTEEAFQQYLDITAKLAPYGLALLCFKLSKWRQSLFLVLYAVCAYYFSLKMVRLILLSAPICASLSGILLGYVLDWCLSNLVWSSSLAVVSDEVVAADATKDKKTPKKSKNAVDLLLDVANRYIARVTQVYNSTPVRLVRFCLIGYIIYASYFQGIPALKEYAKHAEEMGKNLGSPQILFKTRLNNGQEIIVDDYLKAYHWLRDNTPKESRVMAWWDYGYQITGIGERTSIADGNTWNHEHIATLGYCLTAPVKKAHKLIRHLADYVLIWAGGGGDDFAKSPHLARIGNSVYNDLCPKDPLCSHFGFMAKGVPTPRMRDSLLYELHQSGIAHGVQVDERLFKEVHKSRYGLVRIYKVQNVSKESKLWVKDPANRICDAEGSWYCTGQYPPAADLQDLLKRKRSFGQLEDFNRNAKDDEYYDNYMARMEGRTPEEKGKPKKAAGKSKKKKEEL